MSTYEPDDAPAAGTQEPTPGAHGPAADTRPPTRLDAALSRLVSDGTLSRVQADAVRTAVAVETGPHDGPARATSPTGSAGPGEPPGPGRSRGGSRPRLAEIAGYAGGALVAAAAALFVAELWEDLTDAVRALWLAGTTAVLLAAAAGVAALAGEGAGRLRRRDPDGPAARRRLVATLAALAAGTAAGAAGVAATGEEWLWAGLAASAVALAGWVAVPTAVGAVTTWAASLVLAGGLVAASGDGERDLAPGLTVLVVGLAWAALGLTAERATASHDPSGPFRPGASGPGERLLVLALGCATALVGAQLTGVDSAPVQYVTTAALALAGFGLYAGTGAWPLVATGVVAVTLAVPEAVADWTDGDLGVAGGVLVAGVALLVASGLGLRLRRVAPGTAGDAAGFKPSG